MSITALVEQIRRSHTWLPPVAHTEELLSGFVQRAKLTLPPDMVDFYRICGSAELFDKTIFLLPISGLIRASEAIFGEDSEDYTPSSWWAFCDRLDGDYVGIDLAAFRNDRTPILDLDHDDMSRCRIIARSFTEYLEALLTSDGRLFWLDENYPDLGALTYEPPPSYWRRVHSSWYASLGAECGPASCGTPGCARLVIRNSTKCRRHHYEMLHKMPCPFPE
jgi:hypothetical protein